MTTMVKNLNGALVDFEAAVELMDDELRETLHNEGYDDAQAFFSAYEKAHETKYGEEWELSKANPIY